MRQQLECVEFFLGVDEEPTKCLCVGIKEQASTGGIAVCVCYRPPEQQEQVDEALYRQLDIASGSQALVLMFNFNHPNIC